jgi:lysophospholipid acyltransferase (LPLAT)-like uncharacterized protein
VRAGLLRRIRGSSALRRLAAGLIARYIRFCFATIRWQVEGGAVRDRLQAGRGRHILAIWHGRLSMIPGEMRAGVDVRAVISRNRDGDIITDVVERFGILTLRGSTEDPRKPGRERGGRDVFMAGLAALRTQENVIVALTPDGPRGPALRCHEGVAMLAVVTGVAVVPWTFSVRRGRALGSWDRFLVPCPFTRGVIAYGEPVVPPAARTANAVEAFRTGVERALTALTAAADMRCGRPTEAPPEDPTS